MDQIIQHLQKQEEHLQSQLDAKLEIQAEKQSRIIAFVCMPVLLGLASDVLSLTLSAVKPDAGVHERSDVWSTPLQQHKNFASSLSTLCTKMHCPLGASSMAAAFDKIRFDRNGKSHAHWLLACFNIS